MNKIQICYWDMDGTFIDTPTPEIGKQLWSLYYNTPYLWEGWWGRLESMDLNVFTLKPRPETLKMYNELQGDNILHFIHTSRMPKFEPVIKQVLDMNNIHMDGIMTAKGSKNKGERIVESVQESIAKGYLISDVYFFDDRMKEIVTVEAVVDTLKEMGITTHITKLESDATD